jgi:hypothetical protein
MNRRGKCEKDLTDIGCANLYVALESVFMTLALQRRL